MKLIRTIVIAAIVACLGTVTAFAAQEIIDLSKDAQIGETVAGIVDSDLEMAKDAFELNENDCIDISESAEVGECTKPADGEEVDSDFQMEMADGFVTAD